MRWQNSITIYYTDVVNRGCLTVTWISMNERLVYFYICVISSDTFYYTVCHSHTIDVFSTLNERFHVCEKIVQGTNLFYSSLFFYLFLLLLSFFWRWIKFSMFVNEDYYRLSKFITYINYSNVYRDESLHVHTTINIFCYLSWCTSILVVELIS